MLATQRAATDHSLQTCLQKLLKIVFYVQARNINLRLIPGTSCLSASSYTTNGHNLWVGTSVGELLVDEGVVLPALSVSARKWFIRYFITIL